MPTPSHSYSGGAQLAGDPHPGKSKNTSSVGLLLEESQQLRSWGGEGAKGKG